MTSKTIIDFGNGRLLLSAYIKSHKLVIRETKRKYKPGRIERDAKIKIKPDIEIELKFTKKESIEDLIKILNEIKTGFENK